MQALWKIFTLCTGTWLTHHDPRANYCSACEKRTDVALDDLSNTSRKGKLWSRSRSFSVILESQRYREAAGITLGWNHTMGSKEPIFQNGTLTFGTAGKRAISSLAIFRS